MAKPAHRMASIATLVKLAREGEDGRHWYDRARVSVWGASRRLGVGEAYFACILAATSPQVPVSRSITLALDFVRAGSTEGMLPITRKACLAIKQVRDSRPAWQRLPPQDYLPCLGPKTGPFALALLGDPDAVVIDVWVCRALGIEQGNLKRKATRARAEQRIRLAAEQLGWPPAQAQAAIWTTAYRRKYPNGNPPPFTISLD